MVFLKKDFYFSEKCGTIDKAVQVQAKNPAAHAIAYAFLFLCMLSSLILMRLSKEDEYSG